MGRDQRLQEEKLERLARERRAQHRARAEKLVRDAGLPEKIAMAVAREEMTLAQAIADLARIEQVKMLMRKHDLNKSLATQVAMGQAELEETLFKRRLSVYVDSNRTRSCLEGKGGESLHFWTHGQNSCEARIVDFDRYELRVEIGGESEVLHKLQLKLASAVECAERVGAELEKDPDSGPCEPIPSPQDRYHLSDRRLMSLMESGDSLSLKTLEGDRLQARLEWFSRWELGMRTAASNTEVVVFRHSISHLERD